MDVRTRTLECFVTAAEELSFTRAADRLGISQPGVSRQISRLEADLGSALFVRGSRDVQLTTVGATLLEPVRNLLAAWESAQRVARTVAAQDAGVLRVGFEATGAGRLIGRSRAEFTARFPGTAMELVRYGWGGEVDALRRGLVDVAFIWLPADTTGLCTRVVVVEPRVVGVAAEHRLACRETLSLADLRGEPMPWARHAPREWVSWWAAPPGPDVPEPAWGPPTDNAEETLEYVAAGPGVCVMPQSMAEAFPRPDLVWIPLTDAEPLSIAIGWPHGSRHTLVAPFVRLVEELASDRP